MVMKLYLVRHGIATQHLGPNVKSDAQRPLTDEGRAETKVVASALKRLGIKPDLIVTSPLVRALQTAEILHEVLSAKEKLQICDALAPAGVASNLYKFLRDCKSADDVFLVGHEPDMGRLAATLLWAGPELDIPFKKAGVCRIDVASMPPNAPGTLKWFITPKLATQMAK